MLDEMVFAAERARCGAGFLTAAVVVGGEVVGGGIEGRAVCAVDAVGERKDDGRAVGCAAPFVEGEV